MELVESELAVTKFLVAAERLVTAIQGNLANFAKLQAQVAEVMRNMRPVATPPAPAQTRLPLLQDAPLKQDSCYGDGYDPFAAPAPPPDTHVVERDATGGLRVRSRDRVRPGTDPTPKLVD